MEMNEILKLAAQIVEKLGIDLPNDQLNALIDGIKAKLKADDVLDAAGKLFNLLKK